MFGGGGPQRPFALVLVHRDRRETIVNIHRGENVLHNNDADLRKTAAT